LTSFAARRAKATKRFALTPVYDGMMARLTLINQPGGHVVPRARSTDALGHALRQAFSTQTSPGDLSTLIQRLDRRPHDR